MGEKGRWRQLLPPASQLGIMRVFERRRARIIEEVRRNRAGEYTIPTWVLAVILVVLVAGVTLAVIFAPA